jgi:hypothetical protein
MGAFSFFSQAVNVSSIAAAKEADPSLVSDGSEPSDGESIRSSSPRSGATSPSSIYSPTSIADLPQPAYNLDYDPMPMAGKRPRVSSEEEEEAEELAGFRGRRIPDPMDSFVPEWAGRGSPDGNSPLSPTDSDYHPVSPLYLPGPMRVPVVSVPVPMVPVRLPAPVPAPDDAAAFAQLRDAYDMAASTPLLECESPTSPEVEFISHVPAPEVVFVSHVPAPIAHPPVIPAVITRSGRNIIRPDRFIAPGGVASRLELIHSGVISPDAEVDAEDVL